MMMRNALVFAACLMSVQAQPMPESAAASHAPGSETLRFNVNWPSGLSVGEGELVSTPVSGGWEFAMKLDLGLPGTPIAESASAKADAGFCSAELARTGKRGRRPIAETTKFDQAARRATRATTGGGASELQTPACAKDALTFIRFLRRELAAGRLPAGQTVWYGAGYETRLQYAGTQKIRAGEELVDADKLTATVKGPSAAFTVEMFFSREPLRKPVVVRLPTPEATLTIEFER